MVKYNTILKVIDQSTKCLTLKKIREQISPMLKQITDNEEEYDLLMEIVPRFYKDNYAKKREFMICIDNNGKEYQNEGFANMVNIPNDAYIEGQVNGLLLNVHNHDNGVAFQSDQDYFIQNELNIKYQLAVTKNAITITKKKEKTIVPKQSISEAYAPISDLMNEDYKPFRDYKKLGKLYEKYKFGEIGTYELHKEENREWSNFFNKTSETNRVKTYSDMLNVEFEKRNIPLETSTLIIDSEW